MTKTTPIWTNTANTATSGKDSAPPLGDTLPSQKKKPITKKKTSKKTKMKTTKRGPPLLTTHTYAGIVMASSTRPAASTPTKMQTQMTKIWTNTANTATTGNDTAPPLGDTLPSQKKTKKKKKKKEKRKTMTKKEIKTNMNKKTKTKTKLNAKTTVARIPVVELLVVDLVVNFILADRIVSQSQMQTQMRSQIMIN